MTYTPAPVSQPPARSGWSGGRVFSVVLGAVLLLVALALVVGSTVALVWWGTQRTDGYLTSGTVRFTSAGYAVTSDRIELAGTGRELDRLLGTVRIRATSSQPDQGVFVGIAPADSVDGYLTGVAHSTVHRFQDRGRVSYHQVAGGSPPAPPVGRAFWAVSAAGPGTQTVTWKARSGTWSIVLMRPDAAQGVSVRADLGATVPGLPWLAGGVLVLGVLIGLGAMLLLVVPLRRVGRQLDPSATRY